MKNLVITTVGKKHCAASWLDGGGFDVVLIDYSVNQVFKYPGIYRELTSRGLWDYNYYWMPDEDVEVHSEGINEMFRIMEECSLDLAQPSIFPLDHDSFPSWQRFVHCDGPDVIPTDFVEIMCPAFSKDAVIACMETFPQSMSGWGLDLVWSKILENRNIAIINSVVAKHTREVGAGGLYKAIRKHGVLPSQDRKRLMKEYGITEHSILNK